MFFETFKNSYVQLFDDRKYWPEKPQLPRYDKVFPIKELYTRLKLDKVRQLNDLGIGVFFTPNPCSGGRKESDVTAIEWVYVDMDSGSKVEQMERIKSAPILPSIIIESLRSYHCYWRCDMSAIQFADLVQGVILYFNGDGALSSSNEVLRLPQFKHWKYQNQPFEIKMLRFRPEERLNYADLIKAYPKPVDSWKRQHGTDDIEVLKDIPIKEVLDRFGVQYTRNNELIENGEVTSAVINVKQNYINRFSGKPPSGSTIDVVMHFNNCDVKGAIYWLRDQFFQEKKAGKTQLAVKDNYLKRYTWGTQKLNHSFAIIKREKLIVVYGTRGQGKTTYIFDMMSKNAKLGHKVLFFSLEMEQETLVNSLCAKYAGISIQEEYDYAIPEHKQEAFNQRKKELSEVPNLIFRGMRNEDNKSWESIVSEITSYDDLDLIVIDNLDLIAGKPGEDNNQKQNRIIKEMMTFVSTCKIPIILLHHQRKFSTSGRTSGMDDMSGSGKVADTADYVVRVIRDTDPTLESPEKYKTVLFLEKGREYSEGMESIYFYRGSFVDVYPTEKSWEDPSFWQNNI